MTDALPPPAAPPQRQRRKEARPSEIVAAALQVFAEKGFGEARMEEVARRAGVSKGTVFVYFPTKQDLFRAVAQTVVAGNFERLESAGPYFAERPLTELVPLLLTQAGLVGASPVSAVIRMLISESRAFPDIAQVWHDEVVARMLGFLTVAIEKAQARGEVRAGDARLYALSIIGPMVAGFVFRQVFRDTDARMPDLAALAAQHARTVLYGLMETAKT
jgi:AcrR family transcriptional regulator